MEKKFYITTPIYYANDKPHIGHAYTTIAADVLRRFHEIQGEDVFLLAGMDEHGLKIQKAAEKAKKEPQEFVDKIADEFKSLWDKLNIKYDGFIRTTNPRHKEVVQKVLQNLFDKGAIYKGEYEGLYCVGCEQFKSENELVGGKCADHDTVPEKMKEKCYLLKMSELQDDLIRKIESDEFKISPERYKKEILSFLKTQKLHDVSVSRKNISWGIPLPFDEKQTSYVWFDAFLNYLTGIGWPASAKASAGKDGDFEKFWPADIQLIGKDILRVHATIWPIMLMHLGISLPKEIFVHGHILSGGKKMSKTLGNVIGIEEMLEKFGVDSTRYLLMSAGTFGEDVDVTMERMVEKYNADLANGLGNLVSRVVKLNSISNFQFPISKQFQMTEFQKLVESMELDGALNKIWEIVRKNDKFIEDNKPWELAKNNESKFKEVMNKLVLELFFVSEFLIPFMPETAEKIKKALETKEATTLFPRIK